MMSKQRMHEGTLFLDQNKRYCVCEPERIVSQMVTLTSGCALEVLRGGEWVSGCVEGDGQDYWFFVKAGGKFKLAERMVVRYTEPE
jgi:hypothetical protein